MYIHTHTHTSTHTHTHVHASPSNPKQTGVSLEIIYICTYIHTYIHTYIQTDRQTDRQIHLPALSASRRRISAERSLHLRFRCYICYVVALIACVRSTFGNDCILSSFFSFILTSNKILCIQTYHDWKCVYKIRTLNFLYRR